MDRRKWKLFAQTWLLPLVITLTVLAVIYAGYFFYTSYHDIAAQHLPFPVLLKLFALVVLYGAIICLNGAVFFVSCLAGSRLARRWWQLPLTLFPRFLVVILGLSIISFLLAAFVKPAIYLRQSNLLLHSGKHAFEHTVAAGDLFSLYAIGDSLDKRMTPAKEELKAYAGKSMSRTYAYENAWLDTLQALGITENEVVWLFNEHTPDSGYHYHQLRMEALLGGIHRIQQQQIDLVTEQQWRCYQQPLYLLLFFPLGLFLGFAFHRNSLWILAFFTQVIYFLYVVYIGEGIENAAKKDKFDAWFVYLLPVFLVTTACVVLYVFLRKHYKPTISGDRIPLN